MTKLTDLAVPHLYILCMKSEENLEVYCDIFIELNNYSANKDYPRKLFYMKIERDCPTIWIWLLMTCLVSSRLKFFRCLNDFIA
jgi:hypothetical protein